MFWSYLNDFSTILVAVGVLLTIVGLIGYVVMRNKNEKEYNDKEIKS